MSLHSDTLTWFHSNQSLRFPLSDACLSEKQKNTNFIAFILLDRVSVELTIYRTESDYANHLFILTINGY